MQTKLQVFIFFKVPIYPGGMSDYLAFVIVCFYHSDVVLPLKRIINRKAADHFSTFRCGFLFPA